MQAIKLVIKRDVSNDNAWTERSGVIVATGYPRQHPNFTRDAVIGCIVGVAIVAFLWSLT